MAGFSWVFHHLRCGPRFAIEKAVEVARTGGFSGDSQWATPEKPPVLFSATLWPYADVSSDSWPASHFRPRRRATFISHTAPDVTGPPAKEAAGRPCASR